MLRLLTNFPTAHGAEHIRCKNLTGLGGREGGEEAQCQCVTVCDRFDKPLSVVWACHPLDYSPTC